MPGLIAHYICGQAVLPKSETEAKNAIERHLRLYNIGCQGPDIFFYYLTGGGLRAIGTKMHGQNVSKFLGAMAKGIKEMGQEERDAAFAYFCGYLTHYCLDCAAHPYVYYKTGFLQEGQKSARGRLRFLSYHMRFETALDVMLLNAVAGKKPRDQRLWQLLAVGKKEAAGVAAFVSGCINAVYGAKTTGKNVLNAMGHMAFLTRIFQSRRGVRKKMMAAGEHVFLGMSYISGLIHPQEANDGIDYLNEGKSPWKRPWNGKAERNESFLELMELAADEAAELIALLWDFLMKDAAKEPFLNKAGDRSFKTGMAIGTAGPVGEFDLVYSKRQTNTAI